MARYSGKVGFIVTKENPEGSGVWVEMPIERQYYGDVIKNYSKWEKEGRNDSIEITNTISIIADPFAYENFHAMRYIEFMGSFWDVKTISVERPRLILSIGGIYNGEQA